MWTGLERGLLFVTDTWLDFLFKGGILMIPILLCSVFGLALILDRLYAYRKMKIGGFELGKGVKSAVRRGDFAAAAVLMEGVEGVGAGVLRGTFQRLQERLEQLNKPVKKRISTKIPPGEKLERREEKKRLSQKKRWRRPIGRGDME